jgi:hypothetical protein
MNKERTRADIRNEIYILYQKVMELKEKLTSEKADIDFKLSVLDKIYLEKKQELELEQTAIAECEVRKELGI